MIKKLSLILLFFATFFLTIALLFQVDFVKKRTLDHLRYQFEKRSGYELSMDEIHYEGILKYRLVGAKLSSKANQPLFAKEIVFEVTLPLKLGLAIKADPLDCTTSIDLAPTEWLGLFSSDEKQCLEGQWSLNGMWDKKRFNALGNFCLSKEELSFKFKDATLFAIPFTSRWSGSFGYLFSKDDFELLLDGTILDLKNQYGFDSPIGVHLEVDKELGCSLVISEEGIDAAGIAFKDLKIEVESFPFSNNFETTFSIVGKIDKEPFATTGLITVDDSLLRIEDVTLKMKEVAGSFKLLYHFDERIAQVDCSLATDRLSQEIAYFGLGAKGQFFTRLNCTTYLDETLYPVNPKVRLIFNSQELSLGDLTLRDLFFDIDYDKLDEKRRGNLVFDVDEVIVNGDTLSPIHFKSDLLEDEPSPFKLAVGSLDILGSMEYLEGKCHLFFQDCQGQVAHLPLKLTQGAYLTFSLDEIAIDGLNLQVGSQDIALFGRYNYKNLDLDLHISQLSLEQFQGLNARGIITFDARLFGPLDQLEGKGSCFVRDFSPKDYPKEKLFPATGRLEFTFSEGHIRGKGQFQGISEEGIALQCTLPLYLGTSYPYFEVKKEAPLDLQATVTAEISPFLDFLLADTTSATGLGKLRMQMTGTLNRPLLYGLLEIRKGTYESLNLGSIVQNIEGEIQMEGNRLTISRLVGFDTQGGMIQASGELLLDPEKGYPFDVLLTPERAQILKLDYAVASATGQIHFKGDKNSGILEGEVAVTDALITLPEETPALLNTIEVEYINQPDGERPPTTYGNEEDSWPLKLDLKIDLLEPARVVSSNLKSEWRGRLELKGDTGNPLIYGQGKIVRGQFNFNGKELNSTEGMIYFSGEPGRKTTLYIIAREEIDDLKIEVIVKGPMRSPELAFRSNPPKSTREILSYLLFNRGLGDISPVEGEELTQNIIKLNDSQTSGPNLLDKLRQSFGIDRLELSSQQGGDPDDVSLSVGKYFSKRFLLSLKKSMSDKPNQAAIEADLTNNFKAQAEVGDDAQGRMILKWEKDY